VRKILFQILRLLWKVLRQVFWAWLKPMLGRVLLFGALLFGLLLVVVMVFLR
jgi:hypothetical protein